ncbi:MAG: B12-binding domain-containing radical SAM protein [Candidatus Nanoarchaeia archaeon]|nr:B12-binding domain-containing radical SAM protein [Candidatus Nanoarchaeia archaeon]
MKKNIFVFLNTSKDLYLTSQVKNYLDKKNIDYKMDYYDFNNESVAQGNDIDNFVQIVENYYNKESLFNGINISEKKRKHIENQFVFFENLKGYDIYCFSLYDAYLSIQPIIALFLKEKYPNSKITFGGPEVILNDFTYESLKSMGFYCTRGDFEESLYQLLINEKEFYNSNHFYNLSKLTKDDVPKYSKDELEYLNYNIMISSSRGCANNCYFCSSPALSRYNLLKRDVLIEWFKYYNQIGVKSIRFNDSTLNKFEFDKLLDGLIKINNKIKIQNSDLAFDGLTIEQVKKMKKAGFNNVAFGIECLHPTLSKNINKKMPSLKIIYSLLKELNKQKISVKLFYIVGIPSQTIEIFYEELKFLKKINKDFSNISFEFYDYFISPKSYIEKNYEKFSIKSIENKNFDINYGKNETLKKLLKLLKYYEKENPNNFEILERINVLYKEISNCVHMIYN